MCIRAESKDVSMKRTNKKLIIVLTVAAVITVSLVSTALAAPTGMSLRNCQANVYAKNLGSIAASIPSGTCQPNTAAQQILNSKSQIGTTTNNCAKVSHATYTDKTVSAKPVASKTATAKTSANKGYCSSKVPVTKKNTCARIRANVLNNNGCCYQNGCR